MCVRYCEGGGKTKCRLNNGEWTEEYEGKAEGETVGEVERVIEEGGTTVGEFELFEEGLVARREGHVSGHWLHLGVFQYKAVTEERSDCEGG